MKKLFATVLSGLSMAGVLAMYFSSTFVPVYVNGEYVLANQILRYVLYTILIIVIVYTMAYAIAEEDKPQNKKSRRR